ncbi:MAG: tetratricopeptide repeat protein, partial [Bacteroidales bacterium]|nr:tetratricopeptide repeat protein [Bacteroidales bacterium]
MKKNILLILLIFLCHFLSAQNLNLIVKSADKAFEQGNYYGAARLYEEVLKHNNKFYDINYLAAESYRLDNDYVRAIPYYKYVAEKAKKHYPLAEFHLANMYKSNEDYFSAQFHFTNYYNANKKDSTNFYTQKAKQEIIFCEKAINIKYNHTGVLINQLDTSVNSLYSEIGACTMGDSILLFSSMKPKEVDSISEFVSAIYISIFDGEKFSNPEKLSSEINADGYHNASPFFDEETQTLVFTRKPMAQNSKTYIMMSKFENEGFGFAQASFSEAKKLCNIIN